MSTPLDPAELAALIQQIQANPALAAQLQGLLNAASTQQITPASLIATQGGALVHGSVNVKNGPFVGRDYIFQVVQTVLIQETEKKEASAVIEQYLDGLVAELKGLRLYNVDEDIDPQQNALELRDIYVPLDTELQIPAKCTLPVWYNRERRLAPGRQRGVILEKEHRPVSALEALVHHRQLTLLGRGGSGKSTFGAWVLLVLAQAWREQVDAQIVLGEDWKHGVLLPIRVVLREFSTSLPPDKCDVNAGDLWTHVARRLGARYSTEDRTLRYLQSVARKHGALFLLDGLDECGADRDRINGAIDDLMLHWGGTCRFLRTARPSAWPQGEAPDRGVYTLAPLTSKKIQEFIRVWYEAVERRGWPLRRPATQMVSDLGRACSQRDIQPLAGNPLLLTLMAIIHTTRARLPEDRAELYGCAVDLLLLRWNDSDDRRGSHGLCNALGRQDFPLDSLKDVLAKVAYEVHDVKAPYVSEDRLKRAFKPLANQSDDKAAQVIDYIEDRAGLLICDRPKTDSPEIERLFSFPHRTFQEYLAAFHLANSSDDLAKRCIELARSTLSQWEVVLPLVARIAGPDRGASLADALIGRRSVNEEYWRRKKIERRDLQCALLAGLQLHEIGHTRVIAAENRLAILQRVTDWLVKLLPIIPQDGGLTATLRAQAGDVLSRLSDPRFDALNFYLPHGNDFGFVDIRHNLPRIARYPVTVAQFRAFVEATNTTTFAPEALRDPDHRPVRWVNWHEAREYCKWLTGTKIFPPGWRIDLPTETEWDYAARGGQSSNSNYWWGHNSDPERANYDDTGIGDTSVVGCFPPNEYGIYDMLGNILEWTNTSWDINTKGSDRAQVVRGGAWYYPADRIRCNYRGTDRRNLRLNCLGFRVVLRSTPIFEYLHPHKKRPYTTRN